ncbi:MAG: hypothetical protein ACJ8FY_21165 [Gemmataceae bacterium]
MTKPVVNKLAEVPDGNKAPDTLDVLAFAVVEVALPSAVPLSAVLPGNGLPGGGTPGPVIIEPGAEVPGEPI